MATRTSNEILARFMAEPAGRAYFYDFLAGCQIWATTFRANALLMAFAEGERNVGLRLNADLMEANPDAYLLMLKEQGNVRPTADRDTDTDPSA